MRLREWAGALMRGTVARGVCPHQFSFILEVPLRKLHLSPEKLADRLHLSADSRVLEVGPGPGFFSVEVARRVLEGHLALFDLQPEMLVKARRKLHGVHAINVSYTHGDACHLPYAENAFDMVFLVTVLGEVWDPARCVQQSYRVLRPGSLFSVTEQRPDPDFCRYELVRTMAEQAGFQLIERYGRRWNYTANFRKPGLRS